MKINIIDLGRLEYKKALEIQEDLLLKRQNGETCDQLLLVEHPAVLTLGARGEYSNIIMPEEFLKSKGIDVFEVNRGGDVTYHGPGQVVGYPIVDLKNFERDVKQFVFNIEEVFIRLLKDEYGITAFREEQKYTGVWVLDNKITAIGIAVKKWVTMHGFAFNVNTNLEHFKYINPCGITDKGVTSLEKLTGEKQDFEAVKKLVIKYFMEVFGYMKEMEI